MEITPASFLTSNTELKDTEDYKQVVSLLTDLKMWNTFTFLANNCVAASNIIYTALSRQGIPCALVEVELMCTYHMDDGKIVNVPVGFEGVKAPGEIDTHVVVVTKGKHPILIDASISHRLVGDAVVVVDSARATGSNIVGDFAYHSGAMKLLYKEKSTQKIGDIYFKSFIDRVNTDNTLFSSISTLKKLIIVALVIGALNMARGVYDYYNTYISEYSRSQTHSALMNRLDELEKSIQILKDK